MTDSNLTADQQFCRFCGAGIYDDELVYQECRDAYQCRQTMQEELAAIRAAFREAGYVGDDLVAGVKTLRELFDSARASSETCGDDDAETFRVWRRFGLTDAWLARCLRGQAKVTAAQPQPTIERHSKRSASDPENYCHCLNSVESTDSDLVCGNCGSPFIECLRATESAPQPTEDHQAEAIKSLCDRLDKINRLCHRGVNAGVELEQIKDLSGGFMPIPGSPEPPERCLCIAESPKEFCPVHGLAKGAQLSPPVDVRRLNEELCEKDGHVLGVPCRQCLRCHAHFALESVGQQSNTGGSRD